MRFHYLIALLVLAASAFGQENPADLVVIHAKLLTVDKEFTKAEAAAIRDGTFVAVGTTEAIRKLVGEKTKIIDAQGRTVIPGLIESHVHATGASRGESLQPFIQLGSIAEIQDWIRRRAEQTPKDKWIQAPRVDVTRIRERRMPTRAELDVAAPDHAVAFVWQYANRQIQILNSRALKVAKINKDTVPPGRGKIHLDGSGEPTGVIEDSGALTDKYLTRTAVSDELHLASLETLLRRYNELGITSIFERNSNVDGVRKYQRLQQEKRLPLRVTVTIGLSSDGTVESTEKFIKSLPFKFGEGDDWVRVGPLKIGVDGGILYGTAYMREPYGEKSFSLYGINDPQYQGDLRVSGEKLTNMIRTGYRHGWQMSSHVTGDKGVDTVLDAVEAAQKENPGVDRRYTLIHAYFPNPETAQRAARLGVCVDTQPAWYYKDGDALAEALGGERLTNFIGLAEWQKAGVKVALNSDHMQGFDPDKSLNPFNPFLTMYVAVSRKTESGLVIAPEQRVSREDALRMMTIDAAYLGFDESRKGSIETGKLGDFTVLSDDLLTCETEQIPKIRAVATVVGGEVVFDVAKRATIETENQ